MSEVPEDVVANIVSILPVKPLLRFRCVSKSWCSLIDSSEFRKLHLRTSKERNEHQSHPHCDNKSRSVRSVYCSVLWNPSTRNHRILPNSSFENSRKAECCNWIVIYGFGYDVVNDDYKVVKMAVCPSKDDYAFLSEVEVKVYSVKLNLWRRVKDFPYYIRYHQENGVFISGALHWVGNERRESSSIISHLIVAIDLGSEEYRLVPTPEFSDKNFFMHVVDLGGCLCIYCDYFDGHGDVWVMKEYRIKESWTKLVSFVSKQFGYFKLIAYSKCGGKVMLEQADRELLWYDLKKMEKLEKIKIHGLPSFESTDDMFLTYQEKNICLESLVPLHGVGESDKTKHKHKRR
ncbi:F-box protein CPR1-like [Cornus florida]|uniref:F-box protein CPR1-like n=1 Tax=Cornus florida TaxID=4283 RepID=UPI0028A14500|nr:F-box protein CPR1-like [Cornus florida]